jgi:hypothetical protein
LIPGSTEISFCQFIRFGISSCRPQDQKAVLADGSQVALETYKCEIDWFGATRYLEVVANDGEYPLLGVGLLLGHDLQISYRSGRIAID